MEIGVRVPQKTVSSFWTPKNKLEDLFQDLRVATSVSLMLAC